MSMSVLALVLPLLAVDISVPTDDNFDAFPVSETVIPENGRLLASGSTRFLVTHADGGVEDLNATEPFFFMHTRRFATLTPTLVEGDTIALEPVCEGCATEVPLRWPVGPADDDAPAFSDGDAKDAGIVGLYDNDPEQFDNNRYGFNVSVWLPALQLDEQVTIHITGEGVDANTTPIDDDLGEWVSFQVPGPDERRACFEAVATDVAGNDSAPYAFCAELVDDRRNFFGCAQAGASTSMLTALTALLLRRR